MSAPVKRLGEILLSEGVLNSERLKKTLETQGLLGGRIGSSLLELGFVTEESLLDLLGRQRKSKTVSGLELQGVLPSVIKLISEKVARRYRIVPFRLDAKILSIASLDAEDLLVQDEVAFLTGFRVLTFIGIEVRIMEALDRYYGLARQRRFSALSQRLARQTTGADTTGAIPAAHQSLPPSPASVRPETSLRGAATSSPAPAPSPRPMARPSTGSVSTPFLKAGDEAQRSGLSHFEEFSFGETPADSGESADSSTAPALPPKKKPVLEIELNAVDAALISPLHDPEKTIPPSPATASIPTAAPLHEELRPAPASPPSPPAAPNEPIVLEPPPPLPDVEAPKAPATPTTPDEQLEIAARELQNAEMRDDIADALLGFCERYFKRRALLILRKDRIVGWYGSGEGVQQSAVRSIAIPTEEPSVFNGIIQGANFWLGQLPPMPRNLDLVAGLGGKMPKDCLVLPVSLRGKMVCFLYADNLDSGVGGSPMAELRRLTGKAGIAFEVYLLKNKIRTL